MNCQCNQEKSYCFDKAQIDKVLSKYKTTEGSLITILQKCQDINGYLPKELLSYIAEESGIKPSKVIGVATFYTQFRLEPVGKYVIQLCQGTACHVNGSALIEEALIEALEITPGKTTDDGLFTFNNVACLGCCSLSPVMMINDETYGTLTPAKAKEIIHNIKQENC